MTPFEQGYAAFLRGKGLNENPFSKETSPWSRGRWGEGWDKAQRDRMRRLP